MALTKILDTIALNTWYQTDIDDFNYCYLVAKKEATKSTDVVDSKHIVRIAIALGVDSGVSGHPVIIHKINLSFTDAQYSDPIIDKQVVFSQLTNIPSSFYIKVIAVDDNKTTYTSGNVAISLSTNGVKLA